jgi:hypothetical protein
VHRTFVGDLDDPLVLIGVERPLQADQNIDLVQHALLGLALRAIFRMDLAVGERHGGALQRERLSIGVEPHGHGFAGPERHQQKIVRSWPGISATHGDRLVGEQPMWAAHNRVLELAVAGLLHDDLARRLAGVGGLLRHRRFYVAADPGGDHIGNVGGVAPLAQKMVGIGQRHEALRMFGSDKDPSRIVNADGVVGRRMHHEQRLAQMGDVIHQAVLFDIVDELALDGEGAARKRNVSLAVLLDGLDLFPEQAGDVRRVGRSRDSDDGLGLSDLAGRGQDRRTTETVADQDDGRLSRLAQKIGGAHQIGDIGGECRVGEIAFARSEPGEIEAQHADAFVCKRGRDTPCRQHILAAGEAMREQRVGLGLAVGQVERGGELHAAFTLELETFGAHGSVS